MMKLPIDSHLDSINKLVAEKSVVILSSSPGSGKTTRVPSSLMSVISKKIMVLEPRRIAATMAAQRISQENNWDLGTQVGYQVRFENKSQASTQLLFVTEALLLRKLLSDPTLSEFGLIILDEFHERSIHSDTALALLKELQELERPDLKILIMSATLDLDRLTEIWPDAGLVEVDIPVFPLKIENDKEGQTIRLGPDFVDKVIDHIKSAWRNSPGKKDLLVFLPGKGEIDRISEKLEPLTLKWPAEVRKLHGSLSLSEQNSVLAPNPNMRRIILSTNVAESSLTLDGVDTVIDSGLERISNLHHRTGFQSLELVRISKSSARQRAGRAARQSEGLCLQMWAPQDEYSMANERRPEIHRTDLSDLTLLLAGLSVSHPHSLPWLDRPSETRWKESFSLLKSLSAIDEEHRLTEKGKKMLLKPLPARWSSLCVESERLALGSTGEELAALIQAQIPVQDLEELWEQWRDQGETHPRFNMAQRIFRQIKTQGSKSVSSLDLMTLLWTTFPDRLARIRQGLEGSALMSGERAISLPKGAKLKKSPFFFALELMESSQRETLATLYIEITEDFIKKSVMPKATEQQEVVFDAKTNRVISRRLLSYNGCPLSDPILGPAPKEATQHALAQYGLSHWEEICERNEYLKNWILRFRHFERKRHLNLWPLEDSKVKDLCFWAAADQTKADFFFSGNFIPQLEAQLEQSLVQNFNSSCPETLKSPKGRILKVEYREGIPPLVALRIQDAFGWPESPQIMNEPIVIDLLAPNGRPQQRTQDLKNFWKTSYLDVRKDLRARYPKHSWPEDPINPDPEN